MLPLVIVSNDTERCVTPLHAASQAQLEELGALDTQGSELVTARDALLGGALSSLATYSAILRALLPPGYPQQSHHNRWGQAVEALLAAATPEALDKVRRCMKMMQEAWFPYLNFVRDSVQRGHSFLC